MSDTSFELVNAVLQSLESLIRAGHGAGTDKLITARIEQLSDVYLSLGSSKRKPINYADPATRFAYVYSYVAAHSSYVRDLLQETEALSDLLESKAPVKVTCVGGGPGSELVGLLQACVELGRKEPLTVNLLDGEDGWAETWSEVDDQLQADFKVSTHFRCVDVTSYKGFDNLAKAMGADLFVMSYFLSEVYSFKDQADPFFKWLCDKIPAGSLVLYVDNNASAFTSYAEGLFGSKSFELVHQSNGRLLPDRSEQKSVLDSYKKRFGRWPKVQGDASVRVWRKR